MTVLSLHGLLPGLALLIDQDGAGLEVNAVPGEAAEFPSPETRKNIGDVNVLETMAPDGTQERGGGIVGSSRNTGTAAFS